jgi:hypothetical protein
VSKKVLNVEAAESIKKNQLEELDGFKLGEEVWAYLHDGSVGHGVITTLSTSPSGNSATFCDKESNKFRNVYVADLSRVEIKGRRRPRPKREESGIMKLRLRPGEVS